MSGELKILLACAFIVLVGILSLTDEPAAANVEHDNYCARVAAHQLDSNAGHQDYLGQCGDQQ